MELHIVCAPLLGLSRLVPGLRGPLRRCSRRGTRRRSCRASIGESPHCAAGQVSLAREACAEAQVSVHDDLHGVRAADAAQTVHRR